MKVLCVFGTRPEAVKMAPLIKQIEKTEGLQVSVCVTAQHREMLDSVLQTFDIKPDYDLNIMQAKQTISSITATILTRMDEVLTECKPNIVLVHGDTSTSFSAALSAFYQKIPVGHVEAGLRSFNSYSPYPEEMNRLLTARLAEYHFAPTAQNVKNLQNERVRGKIIQTGNTVIDALYILVKKEYIFKSKELLKLDIGAKREILLTAHRRENHGEGLINICMAVKRLAKEYDDIRFIYPVHPSPIVKNTAYEILSGISNVCLTEPLCVQDLHNLISRCYFVMTDSGGLQEEAPALGKPVLVLREQTERPEAVEMGTVKMVGTKTDNIVALAKTLLDNEDEYIQMATAVNPYGDGTASIRIVKALCEIKMESDL